MLLFMQTSNACPPDIFLLSSRRNQGAVLCSGSYRNVITEAKYLLDNTDLSIKEIATKLNFPTQSFFGKYFKQYVGISPKEYRNKLIKQ